MKNTWYNRIYFWWLRNFDKRAYKMISVDGMPLGTVWYSNDGNHCMSIGKHTVIAVEEIRGYKIKSFKKPKTK